MKIRILMWLGLILASWTNTAAALTVEAGLLTRLEGSIEVVSAQGDTRAAVPFMKLAEGDILRMPAGTSAQIVYFEGGRQETWPGGGEVRIAVGSGDGGALQPKVRKLPAVMVSQLEKTPDGQRHGKAGMVVLRSLPDIDAIIAIEDNYATFRAEAAADDTTPELYFLNGMLELKQYDRVREFLDELRTREDQAPELTGIIAHFAPLVALPTGKP